MLKNKADRICVLKIGDNNNIFRRKFLSKQVDLNEKMLYCIVSAVFDTIF